MEQLEFWPEEFWRLQSRIEAVELSDVSSPVYWTDEEYWRQALEYLDRLEAISNISNNVQECRENPPLILNKDTTDDLYNINQRCDSPGDSISEEVLDMPIATWVSKKY